MKLIDDFKTKKSWERLPDESDLAYSYYVAYLEMGPERSLTKVLQKRNKKDHYKTQLGKWSSRFDWVVRCNAYDEHLIKRSLRNREEVINKAHARLLNMLDDALDEYQGLLRIDNIIYTNGEAGSSISALNVKIKTIIDLFDRLGINFSVNEGNPLESTESTPTYQKINNYFYEKLNGHKNDSE